MRVTCISDTHGNHNQVKLGSGDLLIHAGDFLTYSNEDTLRDFAEWIKEQDYAYKVVCAGNHDWICQLNPNLTEKVFAENGIIYGVDKSFDINGYKVFTSPWQPYFGGWAFNLSENDLSKVWSRIPMNTDILVTHGPPFGILDKNSDNRPCGSISLMEKVKRLTNLKLHVFGHIHEEYGQKKIQLSLPPQRAITHSPLFINASLTGGRDCGFVDLDPKRTPVDLEF